MPLWLPAAPLYLSQSPPATGCLEQTAQPMVSIASSAQHLRTDGHVYIAGFDATRWSGHLNAYAIDAASLEIASTPTWSARSRLDDTTLDPDVRQVLTHNGQQGVRFVWNELNPTQQAALQGEDSEADARRTLDYLRGERAHEAGKSAGPLRERDSRLGDIVTSNIWQTRQPVRMGFEHPGHAAFRSTHADRQPVLYVGANDGMLHAFSADDGRELMAYVPNGVFKTLRSYTRPDYQHRYSVDGPVFTGDADLGGPGAKGTLVQPDWRTLLVGGLGGGGRGYFVLDVTTPLDSSSPASSFQPSGVLLDRTFSDTDSPGDEAGKDIGHLYAQPTVSALDGSRSEQIVLLNNRRWAVVMGNGVNSINERPVLLIQYLDGDRELLRIVAHAETGRSNGLSAPRLLDLNGDGRMDIAYAGDLQGNLWRFDLRDEEPDKWGLSTGINGAAPCKDANTCTPLYVAKDATAPANAQPITTAPLWIAHPLGGVQILFGTGRNVDEADRSDERVQTIYAVWDPTPHADQFLPITEGRAALVQQSVTGPVLSRATGTEVATAYAGSSRHAVEYDRSDPSAPRGWYLDLPAVRERVLTNPRLFEGQKAIIATSAPPLGSADTTCRPDSTAESNWINVINMVSGQPAKTPAFATTDATVSLANTSRMAFGNGGFSSIHARAGQLELISLPHRADQATCDPARMTCTRRQSLNQGNTAGLRADWREVP